MSQTVRITETYDLKTTINKMGLIGIHTPGMAQLRLMYPGLIKNHKFIRLLKCDVVGACASVLPADPLQVGVSSGDVAPEDMFNPILYKAVSNDSFETLVNKAYGGTDVQAVSSVNKTELNTGYDDFELYYGLLASKGWKKAMPQRGFAMRGLYPICHTMLANYGNELVADATSLSHQVNIPNDGMTSSSPTAKIIYFKGKSVKMPKIPLHYNIEQVDSYPNPSNSVVPKTFCAVLVTPPARLHEFYYRMRVTWTIRFEGLCSAIEYGKAVDLDTLGLNVYEKGWTEPESKFLDSNANLPNKENSVDAVDVEINKIMES